MTAKNKGKKKKKRLHLCFLISVLSASLGGYIWKYVKSQCWYDFLET